MSAPSVLLLGDFLSGGQKYGQVGPELAARLDGAGWQVLCSSTRRPKVGRIVDMMSSSWRWRADYQLAQIDVYSGRAFLWAESVCWTLRRAGKPYVLVLRGGELPAFLGARAERGRRLLQSAEAVLAPSSFLKRRLEALRPDIQLVPNPIDISAYEFRVREHLRPRLVWLRAFRHIYEPELAVETLAKVRRRFPEARLLMIGPDRGDGSLARTLSRAAALGVETALEVIRGVDKSEVPEVLHRGDIFLNTTRIDNTPVSVLEAMACGLPVVSTNVGGLPYLLDDGRDALLTPPGSAAALAEAVERLLDHPSVANQLALAARHKVEGFDWSVVFPQWERLLRAHASG